MLENVVFVASAKQPQSPDPVRMHRLAVLVDRAVCLQAQFLIPMAITIVFGLGTSSLLVLFVVPAFLTILEDLSSAKQRVIAEKYGL